MIQRSLGIAMAFIGVLVGASFASGREALQYFVAFGNWGVLGAILTSLAMMVSGITILQLGSYHRAKEHTSVFEAISGPITSKILDAATMITLFCIGFVMFAGAGANFEQQFGWSIWIGAIIMLLLVLATGLLNVKKVTFVIGAITPFIIVLIAIATLWTIFTAQPDFATLHAQAQEIPTTLPNWWISAINNLGLNVIVVVSMAIVIGGSFLDSREVGIGGVVGGFVFLFLLAVLVGSMYLSVDTVMDNAMPTLAMITQIHPYLGVAMSFAIYGMIYNTAIGMFYALAKRLSRNKPRQFFKIYVGIVLIGFVLSFIGFSTLIGWVYPILGYMGILVMIIIGWAWFKNRSNLETETELRRRARELLVKRYENQESLSSAERAELRSIAYNSNIPETEFIREIMTEVDTEEEAPARMTAAHATAAGSASYHARSLREHAMGTPVTIRGAVLERAADPRPYAESRPLSISQIELSPPGPGEVLVKISAAGLCHSDLSVVNNNRPRPLPMLLGHESAGVIVELGPEVEDFEVGQHVVMTFLPRCGDCDGCHTNGMIPCEVGSATNAEGTLINGTRHLSREGEVIQHHLGVSGFADHAVVSTKSIVPIGEDVPADIAAIFGCAILTGGGAILNEIKPSPEDTIAVIGLGGVGMAAVITAAALGVKEIVGIDMQESKCDKARELGATSTMTPAEAAESGKRFSAVVEAAGHPKALETAFAITKPGGMTVTVGLPAPGSSINLDPLTITAEARRVHGSYLGSAVPSVDIPKYEKLWREGKLNAEGLVSAHIRLDDINEAMDNLADGTALRQIIMFD